MSVDTMISEILRRESDKFTNDPTDRGGPTKYGVTQRTLSKYFGRPASVEDVQNLTEETARQVYFTMFVRDPGFTKIVDPKLRELLVDIGVNSGPSDAIKWLQRVLGLDDDGVLGPMTADAANRANPKWLFVMVLSARFKHYAGIVSRDPSQSKYIKGWTNRACEFLEDCV